MIGPPPAHFQRIWIDCQPEVTSTKFAAGYFGYASHPAQDIQFHRHQEVRGPAINVSSNLSASGQNVPDNSQFNYTQSSVDGCPVAYAVSPTGYYVQRAKESCVFGVRLDNG